MKRPTLTLIAVATLVLAHSASAQRTIGSLSDLKGKQASELVKKITEKAEQDAREAQDRAQAQARQSKRGRRGSNIQIRRGDTRELDQQQTGEGNFQSANVGTD